MSARTDGNIVLIGMPGAGKSTVGVLLAKRTARDFIDTDVLIQSRHGLTLQAIVDRQGYRELLRIEETELCALQVDNHVLATGGSAVYSEIAMAHLKKGGIVVYIDVPLAVIERRVTDQGSRGLARRADQTLADLYREREPLYRRYADRIVDCGDLSPEAVCQSIIAAIDSR